MGLLLALVFALTGCGLPADPENTLAEARGAELHVGVVHDPPWTVVENGQVVGGVEIELARRFAESIDAKPVFHPGELTSLAEVLQRFEIDLLVAGLTTSSPWSSRLAFAPPYYAEHIIAAGSETSPPVEGLDGATVLYPAHQPNLARGIRSAEGRPEAVQQPPPADGMPSDALVAVPAWQAERQDLEAEGVRLATHHRVMAIPPGENGLLRQFASFLRGKEQTVARLLRQEVAE